MTTDFSSDLSMASLGQAAAAGGTGRSLNIKRLIRMRGPIMVTVSLVIAVPLMVVIWFLVPREYEATALIRFSNSRPTILSNAGTSAISSDYVTHVETQVKLIKSAAVLSRVAGRDDIRSLPIIVSERDPVQFLVRHVKANLQPMTELVSVSFMSNDAQTAKTIVDATKEEYLRMATDAEKLRNNDITKQLLDERDNLEDKVNQLRKSVTNARESVGGVQLPGVNSVDSQFRAYHDALSKALSDQTNAETHIEQIQDELAQLEQLMEDQKANPDKAIYKFGIEDAVTNDGSVHVQAQMLATAEANLAQAKNRYLEGHPQIQVEQENRNAVAAAKKSAEAEARAKIIKSRYEEKKQQLEQSQKDLEDAKTRIANFDTELKKHADESLGVAKALSAVSEQEEALADARDELKRVQERIRELNIESRAPASIEVAQDAQVPVSPDYGQRIKLMALAFMGSCGIGFGIGLLRELSDQQVRTAQDIGYCTDLPLVALIPHADVERLPDGANIAMTAAERPDSRSADEVRRLITRIIYPPEGSAELNTCLVTSATRGDGKTTLACNLAIALSQANRRVLLVDVCARRPSIEKRLNLDKQPGLSEVIANDIRMEDAIRPTQFQNLYVMGPGLRNKELIGKLASRDTVEFLEKAEATFEHVIIDTPPVLLMSDAKLIAPVVDGVVVVVGAEVSTLGMVRRSLTELQQTGANVIGVVLNRVSHMPGGYMRGNLDSFYHYASEHAGEPEAAPAVSGENTPGVDSDDLPTMMILDDNHVRSSRDDY